MAHQVSPFERKKPKFKQQARVLVICEDTKSSLRYLEDTARHFRSHAEVDIVHCGKNDPLNIVKEAIQRLRLFDHVYCAIDRDRHENFDEALALAKNKKKISIIVSNPCYEFWLLLHFKKTRHSYVGVGKKSSGDLLVKDLCKAPSMESYAKGGSENLFEKLLERLPRARQRAAEVMEEALNDGNFNPSTRLHELIEAFERLGTPELVA